MRKSKRKKESSPSSLMRFAQRLVYLLYRSFETLLFLLPLGACWRLGEALGSAAFYIFSNYRRLATRNLTIAFGDEKGAAEIQQLARRHFAALGRNLLCSIRIMEMPLEELEQRVSLEGFEHVVESTRAGKGMLIALSHMGPWEIFTRVAFREKMEGLKGGGTIFQSLANPFLDARMRQLRANQGLILFDRKAGFHQPMALLKEGGGIGILVDQHAGDSGVWCPFFGRLASTSSLAAVFSIRTGTPVFAAGIYPVAVGKWKIVYQEALGTRLEAPPGREEFTSGALTAELNLKLETLIRQAPEEWFWVHNRWKTPQPHFLLSRYRRGVEFAAGFDAQSSLKPFRILVRSPNWLGDACMAIPAVQAIKRGRPDAELTVLCLEKLADLWRAVPEADVILTKHENESPLAVARRLREQGLFDAGVLLPSSLRSALEMKRAGIPRIAGFRGHSRRWLLDQVIPERGKKESLRPPEHHARRYLRLALGIGADAAAETDGLPAPMGGRLILPENEAPPEGGRIRLGLCAGARYGPAKCWPVEHFAQAAARVSERAEVEWVLFGGPGEEADGEKLNHLLGGNCRNLVGRTTLLELMRQLAACRALLTNDTGTMHLAGVLGIPAIAIFGSTEPALTGPLGRGHRILRHHVECSPCFLRECPLDLRCMKAIEAGEAADAVLAVLASSVRSVIPSEREGPVDPSLGNSPQPGDRT